MTTPDRWKPAPWFALLLLLTGAAALASSEPTPEPVSHPRDWGRIDWEDWDGIEALLNDIRDASGIPALAAFLVKEGAIVEIATVGVREYGTSRPVAEDDRFHLGSLTKSMTATVIGKLVEQGGLTWATTLSGVLGDVPMRDEYRDVTMEQLLRHQGGIRSYTTSPADIDVWRERYTGTPTEQRAAFLARILSLEPEGRPGEVTVYSNAGYALAGHIAERLTGKSWEELVREHIFTPLGMKTCGFGHPGTAALPDQPRGHGTGASFFVPVTDDQHPPMEIIAPAGNVHCSIRDLARYALFHLDGLDGQDGYLRSETIRRLHTLPRRPGEMRYAAGWMVTAGENGEPVHHHGGTTGTFYAELKLFPERRAAVAVLMNVGRTAGELVANKVARSLMARHGSRDQPVAGARQAEAGQPRFEIRKPEGAGAPSGMQWKKSDGDGPQISMGETPSAQDDARIWQVVRGLAEAINNEDRAAFLSFFREPDRSHAEMFQFMAAQVLPARGGVHSFHELSPPLVMKDSKYPIRAVTFHLENGYPGYFGLSLDENGKIDHFSLFVKSDLCPNGPDTQCDRIARTLGGGSEG